VFNNREESQLNYHSANSLKQHYRDRHVAPFGHIIPTPNQLVCALTLS